MKKYLSIKKSFLISSAFVVTCFGLIGLMFFVTRNIHGETGGFSVDQVIVANKLEETRPAIDGMIFQPSDTIFCTVKIKGVDGIIGMRWFFGDEIISEGFGRTKNNSISSYITQSSTAGLPEGFYHVDILIVDNQPVETIYFEVKNKPSD